MYLIALRVADGVIGVTVSCLHERQSSWFRVLARCLETDRDLGLAHRVRSATNCGQFSVAVRSCGSAPCCRHADMDLALAFSNALQSPVLADDLGQARFLPDPILGILLRS